MDLDKSIQQAKVQLLLHHPFFATLALRMPMIADATVKTFCTDGREIRYAPEYAGKLSKEQLRGVIAHEVMHCAAAHHARRGKRDPRKWNIACDYAIDPILVNAGLDVPDATVNPAWAGMSAEQIYNLLPDGDGSGNGPGRQGNGCGEVIDAPGDDGGEASPAELAQAEEEWQIAAGQAAQAAAARGKLPAELADLIKQAREPRADWRQELRRFMTSPRTDDYRWTPPNRRFIGSGLYLPSRMSEGLGVVVIGKDTSGSIWGDPALLEQFAGEIVSILGDTKPERVFVIDCDARVQHVQELGPDDANDFDMTKHGGGGTAFEPVFDWIAEQGIQPAAVVYLTDLEGSFPAEPPRYPVLWAATGRTKRAPFGQIIDLDRLD